MQLRDYQSALADEVTRALVNHAVVLQLPTGGGKTYIAASIAMAARRTAKHVWFVCHRREIIRQASESFEEIGIPHGVIGAGRRDLGDRQIKICSVDTIRRHFGKVEAPDFIIWDECHHVAAKSWAELKARFPNAAHLGLTATPERLDGYGLAEHFDRIICGPTTRQLIEAGHLSRYRIFAPTIPDLRGVRVKMGDYSKEQLAERMSGRALIGNAVEHYRRHVPEGRAVVFAVSIEASKAIVARFVDTGIPAAHIDSTTPVAQRDAAIADLEAGRIRVLSNVEIFTEGFDLPAIDAVILLRPTKSFSLFRQMIGRGLRVALGKTETIILDHAGLIFDHGLPDDDVQWTLDGRRRHEDVDGNRAEKLRRCPSCSNIHTWAAECPECGHVYGALDRSIEEVYGELREFQRLPGHVTVHEFMVRARIATSNTVRHMFNRGMPRDHETGMVPLEAALEWLRSAKTSQNRPPFGSKPGEYENRETFGKRVGRSFRSVNKLAANGLPCGLNGWVHVEPALEWLAEWEADPSNWRRRWKIAGYESTSEFARRIGVDREHGRLGLIKRGLPIAENGLVHIETGLAWVAANERPERSERRMRPSKGPCR
jgi:superfamily II DNA or RNA helicase